MIAEKRGQVSIYVVGVWVVLVLVFQYVGQKTGERLADLPTTKNAEPAPDYPDFPLQLPTLKIDPAWRAPAGNETQPTLESLGKTIDHAFASGRAEQISRAIRFTKSLTSTELATLLINIHRLRNEVALRKTPFDDQPKGIISESLEHLIAIRWMRIDGEVAFATIADHRFVGRLRNALLNHWINAPPKPEGLPEYQAKDLMRLRQLTFPGKDQNQLPCLLVRDDPAAMLKKVGPVFLSWTHYKQIPELMAAAHQQRGVAIVVLEQRLRNELVNLSPGTDRMNLMKLWEEREKHVDELEGHALRLLDHIVTSWLFAEPEITDEELEQLAPQPTLVTTLNELVPQRAKQMFETLSANEKKRIPIEDRRWILDENRVIKRMVATRPLDEALKFVVEIAAEKRSDPNLTLVIRALIDNELFEQANELRPLLPGSSEPRVFRRLIDALFAKDAEAAVELARPRSGGEGFFRPHRLLIDTMSRDPLPALNTSTEGWKQSPNPSILEPQIRYLAVTDPVYLAHWVQTYPDLPPTVRELAINTLCSKSKSLSHPPEWKFSWAASMKSSIERIHKMENAVLEMIEHRTPQIRAFVESAPVPASEKLELELRIEHLELGSPADSPKNDDVSAIRAHD